MIIEKASLKTQLGVMLPKEIIKEFKVLCAKLGKAQNILLLEAINDLLKKYNDKK